MGLNIVSTSWCFPVGFSTEMIKCYSRESKKYLKKGVYGKFMSVL